MSEPDKHYTALQDKLEEFKTFFGTSLPHTRKDLERFQGEISFLKEQALKNSPLYQRKTALKELETREKSDLWMRNLESIQLNVDRQQNQAEMSTRQGRTITRRDGLNKPLKTRSKIKCPKCKSGNVSNKRIYGKGKNKQETSWCIKCNLEMVKEGTPRTVSEHEYRSKLRETLYRRD